ncbi:MAG: Ig-like domain-containing protein, partial [Candidatus Zixiibacteriota bacterium]
MSMTMLSTVGRGIKLFYRLKYLPVLIWFLIIPFSQVFAQGSITGTVNNSDMSVPADSELSFWGFLDDTDEEIRAELSDGAGYQNPYWWDDFQNYGTEAAGNPYDYFFSNLVNNEAYQLAGLIPSNSYQEENIVLASVSNPSQPSGMKTTVTSTSRVVVSWKKVSGITYHIYRRYTSSNGSLFRLDDPSGSLSNSGVSDSFFVDTGVDGVSSYTYMVIGEDASGNYTPHSDEASTSSSTPTAPVVASISPNTGSTVGGTSVTIKGENFDGNGVSVTIGGIAATSVVVVSPFEITCLTPAGSAGSADVVVTNIASGLSSSPLTGGFTYYVNTPPIADAGPDQTGVIAGTLVTLDGSGSFDINGDSLGYHWNQISGLSVVLSDSNTVNPTFTPNTGGTYYFQLYVDDAIDYSQPDTVLIGVENQKPVLASIGSKSVDEGQTLEFRISATDSDGDSVILSAENVPTNATFVDSGNGAGSFIFNPEYTQSGVFNVTFIASDGSLADSELVAITVNDVNRQPTLDAIGARNVDEGQTSEFRVSATDPDGDALTLSALDVPTNATFVDSGNGAGSFSFNPDYTQAEVYNVTFIVSDGSLADSELVQVTVNDVNRTPVLDSIGAKFVDEGQTLEFRISAADPDVDAINLSDENVPINATFVDSGNGAGSFTFNPTYDQATVYNVTFIASDGSLADSELVTITVNDVNRAPVADAGSDQLNVEASMLVTLDGSGSYDPDGDSIGYHWSQILGPSFTLSDTNIVNPTFTPDIKGNYEFELNVDDASLMSSPDTVLVSVDNQAPILDSIGPKFVDEGQTLEFRVHASDSDGDALILSAENVPTNASFVDSGNGAGSFTFNPTYDQANVYNVTFIVSDGSLADSESVAITVNDVNRSPILASIGSKGVDEGQTLEFRVSSTDPDGDALTLSAVDVPINATFVDSGNGAGSFNFSPTYDQAETYNVIFIASDGLLADSELVIITVNAVNRSPVLDAIGSKNLDEGQTLEFRVHASDPDGDALTLSAENVPPNATFVDSGNGAGSFTFNPNYTQSDLYNVTFIASDGSLADSEFVAITINDVNRVPVLASIGPRFVDEGQTLDFRVSATDPDGDVLTLSAENVPPNAAFVDSGNGAGSFTFNPDYNQSGLYNVTFIASDGSLVDTEFVAITVNESGNQAPVLDSIGSKTVAETGTLEFRIRATDPESDVLTLTAENVPVNASLVDSGNGAGSFTFNPDYTQAGLYNVTFISSDGSLADSEIVEITVTNTNRAPVLDSIGSRTVIEGGHLGFIMSTSDPDGEALTLTAENIPVNSTFSDSGNGKGLFEFDPDYTQSGLHYITFKASDGDLVDSEVVEITVIEAGNQSPALDFVGPQTVAETQTLIFKVSATDPDGTTPALMAFNWPANSTFVDSGNGKGSFSFYPNYDQAGMYTVGFVATDGSLADTELVEITVTETNRVPILDSIGAKIVTEGQTLELRVSATDPDGNALTLSAETIPSNATFVDSGNGAGSFTFNPDYT